MAASMRPERWNLHWPIVGMSLAYAAGYALTMHVLPWTTGNAQEQFVGAFCAAYALQNPAIPPAREVHIPLAAAIYLVAATLTGAVLMLL